MDSKKTTDVQVFREWQKSPTKWVEDMFGLRPQPLKDGYVLGDNVKLSDVKASWFKGYEFRMDKDNPWGGYFVKGDHITWQQWVILLAVERAIKKVAPEFISIASGHGIGKTSTLSWLILWGLFCYKESQIPCTANTQQQLYDIMWKELSIWLARLPKQVQTKYELETSYLRITENPKSWFARAATARANQPEALAGVHSQTLVMACCDEASGIADEIFEVGEGALTNENVIMFLISNYTRLSGYFHKSQKNEKGMFQVLSFDAEESPLVTARHVERMKQKYGDRDSDNYRVRVRGLPPKETDVGDDNFLPLLSKDDLRYTMDMNWTQPLVMGVDPAGAGRDSTVIVVRDPFKAQVVGKWKGLKSKEVVEKMVRLSSELQIPKENIILDAFGVGGKVMQEVLDARFWVQGANVGDPAVARKRFTNMKAEMLWKMREWIINGGQLVGKDSDWEDMLSLYYTSRGGRLGFMTKKQMAQAGMKSPDVAEAIMLTFFRDEYEVWGAPGGEDEEEEFDPHAFF